MELDEQLPPWPRLLDIDTQRGVWELLPMNFIIKWSIGGQGWVQVFAYLLHFLTDSDNASLRQGTYTKDSAMQTMRQT